MSRTFSALDPSRTPRLHLAARVAAAVLGGYAFAWGVVALGAAALFAAGMGFHDAEFLASMIGILAYLVAFLWAVATPRPGRCWLVLLGGGALMAAAASAVQAALA
ncbi:hypothetical protein [Pseudoxanthomonas suwonensis]|uniref:Iron uptake protein n=1 Tax=Pseudoxanthomonas suwonensis TaxID=314722 RepID=A0A0E3YZR7_9GAMM|nr:hypothetical protein [Pseudoxanthomonas suwonensis]AKC85629.1 iron uptake protein [Pseudoxanthomonas suwonensis]